MKNLDYAQNPPTTSITWCIEENGGAWEVGTVSDRCTLANAVRKVEFKLLHVCDQSIQQRLSTLQCLYPLANSSVGVHHDNREYARVFLMNE